VNLTVLFPDIRYLKLVGVQSSLFNDLSEGFEVHPRGTGGYYDVVESLALDGFLYEVLPWAASDVLVVFRNLYVVDLGYVIPDLGDGPSVAYVSAAVTDEDSDLSSLPFVGPEFLSLLALL